MSSSSSVTVAPEARCIGGARGRQALLCDASTVMTIQLTAKEQELIKQLKVAQPACSVLL